ncbi:hypothetical protein, partial [Faecalibaculum rodentium]|uniref:hypothetical protein n=1 Tax=Faecalibaculum rodentium TaxID=1702221 RepID=UPI0025A184DE
MQGGALRTFGPEYGKAVFNSAEINHTDHPYGMPHGFRQQFAEKAPFAVNRQEESADSAQYQGSAVSAGMFFPLVFPLHFQQLLNMALFVEHCLTQFRQFVPVFLLGNF